MLDQQCLIVWPQPYRQVFFLIKTYFLTRILMPAMYRQCVSSLHDAAFIDSWKHQLVMTGCINEALFLQR